MNKTHPMLMAERIGQSDADTALATATACAPHGCCGQQPTEETDNQNYDRAYRRFEMVNYLEGLAPAKPQPSWRGWTRALQQIVKIRE